ncbi:MAG: glucokinase [Desulfovibrio sp.]|nr:glucokinase [Desulfovibrio sp.]
MSAILAADIGATNSRFALFYAKAEARGAVSLTLKREIWLPGKEYASFPQILRVLLDPRAVEGQRPFLRPGEADSAILALAGPIAGDSCRLSNLPWLIRAQDVRDLLGIASISLINDFAAQGYACLIPEINDPAVIQEGAPSPDHPAAVIGAGTGLGKALLLPPRPPAGHGARGLTPCVALRTAPPPAPRGAGALPPCGGPPAARPPERLPAASAPADGDTRLLPAPLLARAAGSRILPSEGGHAEFPFLGGEEEDFAAFVRRETGCPRLINDLIVSGPGLGHLHAFLTGVRLPDAEASENALRRPEVLNWFARFYARACRNFVLETLALRGLFITGGMALRLPVLSHPAFLPEFWHSAAHRNILEQIPIRHLQDPRSGLRGAALCGVLREKPEGNAGDLLEGASPPQTPPAGA